MEKPRLRSLTASLTVAGMVFGSSVNAVAAGDYQVPAADKPVAHFAHKTGHPFKFQDTNSRETAEFARMETAPDSSTGRRGPPMKTGNPFLNLN